MSDKLSNIIDDEENNEGVGGCTAIQLIFN